MDSAMLLQNVVILFWQQNSGMLPDILLNPSKHSVSRKETVPSYRKEVSDVELRVQLRAVARVREQAEALTLAQINCHCAEVVLES